MLIVWVLGLPKRLSSSLPNQVEKLRRELEAAVEALEQGRQELSSFAEQVLINMMLAKITRMMKVLTKRKKMV